GVLVDGRRARTHQGRADPHQERRLPVARVAGKHDDVELTGHDRWEELRVEAGGRIRVTGELVVEAPVARVADRAVPVQPAEGVDRRVDDAAARCGRGV